MPHVASTSLSVNRTIIHLATFPNILYSALSYIINMVPHYAYAALSVSITRSLIRLALNMKADTLYILGTPFG